MDLNTLIINHIPDTYFILRERGVSDTGETQRKVLQVNLTISRTVVTS